MKTDHMLSGQFVKSTLFFIAVLLLLAQEPARGQIRLTLALAPELRNSQILRVSDFNITGSGSVSRLFELRLTNIVAPTNVIIRFQLLSDRFPSVPIVEATSAPLPVSPPLHILGYQDIQRGGDITYNSEAVKELTDAILQTGKLPNGTYTFILTAFDARQPGIPQDSQREILTISNPTMLDLISPGAAVGGGDCVEQFGLLPQFKWNSNAKRFLITVCEVLPNNSSPEDVMQNEPRLQRLVQRGVDFIGSPSFIYPSGGLPLQFGKTYYWQVQAIIDSPSGEVRLPSEIWCFQISSINNRGGAIQQLLNLLGSSDLEALFGEGGPLQGFKPTGAVTIDGRRIELAALLNMLRNQSIKAVSVQVE
ncbi:MAG: hypothetical protein ONB46_04295 [candidate division KSB1 bacterium]|nr:hypothetical protein [candidate division KSB1 bacterium]MDZ7365160.1 hypothetical protein [candidate division KSB1 bacterium]MDZ7404370.1 hypothetical protein [candidate division KSB1 bacterium]